MGGIGGAEGNQNDVSCSSLVTLYSVNGDFVGVDAVVLEGFSDAGDLGAVGGDDSDGAGGYFLVVGFEDAIECFDEGFDEFGFGFVGFSGGDVFVFGRDVDEKGSLCGELGFEGGGVFREGVVEGTELEGVESFGEGAEVFFVEV